MAQGPTPFPDGIYVPQTFFKPLLFAHLSAAAAGPFAMVSDSPVSTPGAIVSAGGGSFTVPVFYDGTNWRVAGGSAAAGAGPALPNAQYSSISGSTVTAAEVAGATITVLASSGATALTTPTAAQIIAAVPGWQVGQTYILWVNNTDAGTLTLTGGTGVTITGTATVATNRRGEYLVTYTGAGAVGMQYLGSASATT